MWVINCISCIFSIVQVLFPISNYMYSYTVHQFRSPEILPNRSHLKKVGPIHSFEMRNFVDTHWKFDEENPRWSQKTTTHSLKLHKWFLLNFYVAFMALVPDQNFHRRTITLKSKSSGWCLGCWIAILSILVGWRHAKVPRIAMMKTWHDPRQINWNSCVVCIRHQTPVGLRMKKTRSLCSLAWPQFFPTIFGVLIGQLLAMKYCWCMFLLVSIHLKNTVKRIHLRMSGIKVNNAW